MENLRDFRLALMAGVDIPVPELALTMHSPQIKEIALVGEKNFFAAMQYLCLDKNDLIQDKSILEHFTNFQVLMKVLEQNKQKKECVKVLLQLLIPSKSATMLPNSIIFSEKGVEQPVVIDDNNFDVFQDCAKEVLCAHSLFQGNNVVYNPGNEAARKIMEKIMAGRRKVAELQSAQHAGESVLVRYLSILTVGTNTLSLSDCQNLNLFQLFDLIERLMAYIEWDIDLRVRLAGGKPDKQVDNWMRDMHPS